MTYTYIHISAAGIIVSAVKETLGGASVSLIGRILFERPPRTCFSASRLLGNGAGPPRQHARRINVDAKLLATEYRTTMFLLYLIDIGLAEVRVLVVALSTSEPARPASFEMIIRPYEMSDYDAVLSIYASFLRGEPKIATVRRLGRPASVAVVGQDVVGLVSMNLNGVLTAIFVLPSYRRKGIASGLLEAVEGAARNIGLAGVTADVSQDGSLFLLKRGFAVAAALSGRPGVVRLEKLFLSP